MFFRVSPNITVPQSVLSSYGFDTKSCGSDLTAFIAHWEGDGTFSDWVRQTFGMSCVWKAIGPTEPTEDQLICISDPELDSPEEGFYYAPGYSIMFVDYGSGGLWETFSREDIELWDWDGGRKKK